MTIYLHQVSIRVENMPVLVSALASRYQSVPGNDCMRLLARPACCDVCMLSVGPWIWHAPLIARAILPITCQWTFPRIFAH